jgi:hypothetical protein
MLLFAALLPAYGQQSASAPVAAAPANSLTAVPQATSGAAQLPAQCSDKANSTLPKCPTKKERQRAEREFHTALKLQKRSRTREAYEHFKAAAQLAPDNAKYLQALELARQDLVVAAIRAGNQARAAGNQLDALLRFREARQLDPNNEFARQALENALPPEAPGPERKSLAGIVRLQPEPGVRKFHLRGSTRDIVSQVTLAYGLTAIFDDSVSNRAVRLDMEDASWREAMTAVTLLTKILWTPLSARQVLFAADTDENRRSLLRTAQRTFYLTQATTPQALNDISTSLRTLFEIRFAVVDAADRSITVRADSRTLDAVGEYLDTLRDQLPEVIFQVDVFQIAKEYTRAIGANIPTQFQVFNIPTEIALITASASQSQISQLLASLGGQTSSTAIAGLLAQVLGQQQSSLLSQPFVVFGGGTTLSGLTVPPASVSFSQNHSTVRQLQSMTLRASQGTPAVMKIGERYPILNASYSSMTGVGSSPLTQLLGTSTSSLAAYPSFTYEDIGFNMKATPVIHRDNSVSIKLEMQLRSLGTQTVNGLPVINNIEFNGYVSAKDGEPIAAASNLTQSESRTLQGYSFLASIPGLTNRTTDEDDDELMVILTPRVVIPNPEAGPNILLPNIMPR